MNCEFNLNEHILVKLKDEGYELWREQWNKHLPENAKEPLHYFKNKADSNGYVRFQAWNFMEIFGGHIHFGSLAPFHLTILIPKL